MVKSRIGKQDEARNAIANAMARSGDLDPADMLLLRMAMGNADQSFEWLEKCYATLHDDDIPEGEPRLR